MNAPCHASSVSTMSVQRFQRATYPRPLLPAVNIGVVKELEFNEADNQVKRTMIWQVP